LTPVARIILIRSLKTETSLGGVSEERGGVTCHGF